MKSNKQNKSIFFLTGEWTALKRFVRGEVDEPEGMPSVYKPWQRFRERGYDVHVFMIGQFEHDKTIHFKGCNIHLVSRSKFFQWRNKKKKLRGRFPADQFFLYRAAKQIGDLAPPSIVCAYQPWHSFDAYALCKRYGSVHIKRIFGTWLYKNWFRNDTLKEKLSCLPHFLAWRWPFDLMIISNDGTEGDKVANFLGITNNKFKMLINGVDKNWDPKLSDVHRIKKEYGIKEDRFILLCLSRLSKWKRQDRVIQAMPAILEKIPEAQLILAGDGPMREQLQNMAKELGVLEHVKFLGMVLHSKVREIMNTADIFLQTNDLSCLGNTLLEALVCGRTIITWDIGATRDVIVDDSNAVFLPDVEPNRLANTVISLYKDPARRKRLAHGARKFAEEHLQTWDERIDEEIDMAIEKCIQKQQVTYKPERKVS